MVLFGYRQCVLYSDNSNPSSSDITNELSKCSIKDVEKPQVDRSSVLPMTRYPVQIPQNIQGIAS